VATVKNQFGTFETDKAVGGKRLPVTAQEQEVANLQYGKNMEDLTIRERTQLRKRLAGGTVDTITFEQYFEDYKGMANDPDYKPKYIKANVGTGMSAQQLNQGGGDGPKGDFGIFGNLLKDTAKEFNVQTYDEELGDFIDTKITGYKNVNSGLYQDKFGKNLQPAFSNKGQAFGLAGIVAQALGLTPDTVGGYVPGSIKGKYDGITDMFGSLKNFKIKNKRQVLRNCVYPDVGKHVLECAIKDNDTRTDN